MPREVPPYPNERKMGILEKIAEIEKEINRTQKNKGNMMFDFNIEY